MNLRTLNRNQMLIWVILTISKKCWVVFWKREKERKKPTALNAIKQFRQKYFSNCLALLIFVTDLIPSNSSISWNVLNMKNIFYLIIKRGIKNFPLLSLLSKKQPSLWSRWHLFAMAAQLALTLLCGEYNFCMYIP